MESPGLLNRLPFFLFAINQEALRSDIDIALL